MSVVAQILLERGGSLVGTTARFIGLGRRLLKSAVPGSGKSASGSKITSGPLKVGGKVVYGKKAGVSTAAKVAGAVGASAGFATVASHRRGAQALPSPSPTPRRSTSAPTTTTSDRKCCPAGTKRMVCFKRGKVKDKTHARKPVAHRSRAKKARRQVTKKRGSGVPKRAVSAKQAAARKRFAAAARRGPIQKGARL